MLSDSGTSKTSAVTSKRAGFSLTQDMRIREVANFTFPLKAKATLHHCLKFDLKGTVRPNDESSVIICSTQC